MLAQTPAGQMTITRRGLHIAKTVYSEDDSPHRKVLMSCAESFHAAMGDGVKSFLFTVTAMLRSCVCLDAYAAARIVHQLGMLQSKLSQITIENLLFDGGNTGDNTSSLDIVNCLYSRIISTFFSTLFPAPVSSALGSLLHCWVAMSSCICTPHNLVDKNNTTITCLYKDFPLLCRYHAGVSSSVSDSFLVNGFIVSRRALNLSKSGPRKLVVLMLSDSDSEEGKFDDLDVKCEVNRLINDLKQNKLGSKNNYEVLLVTSVVLSDLTLFNLYRENVAVIQGADIDEVRYLSCLMLRNKTSEGDVTTDAIIEVVYDDCKEYTLISIPGVTNLIICGPTKDLRKEYAEACRSALKLLTKTCEPALYNLYAKCGGEFERNLHRHLVTKFDLYKIDVPRLSNRSELLAWHKEKTKAKENPTEMEAIYSQLGEAFVGVDKDIVQVVLDGINAVPCKLQSTYVSSVYVEPVVLRVGILLHAIGTVITLVRIDGGLFTKKTSKSRISLP